MVIGDKINQIFLNYFHIQANFNKLPVLLHIYQHNTDEAVGMPQRHMKMVEEINMEVLDIFVSEIK